MNLLVTDRWLLLSVFVSFSVVTAGQASHNGTAGISRVHPAVQPTASKQCRELKALTLTKDNHLSDLIQQLTLHDCLLICQTTTSSLPPLGTISFDHQIISGALSLVPVHVRRSSIHCCWTTPLEQSSYTCPLTWFILGHLPPQTENVLNCSRHQCLVTVTFRRCV